MEKVEAVFRALNTRIGHSLLQGCDILRVDAAVTLHGDGGLRLLHAFAGLIRAAHGLLLAGRGALAPLQYLIDAVALEVDRRILLG